MGGKSRSLLLGIVCAIFAATIISCAPKSRDSKLYTTEPVQRQSPLPIEGLPPEAGAIADITKPGAEDSQLIDNIEIRAANLDPSFKNLRVRVFPLLSAPAYDPYPATTNRNYVYLFNSKGLKITSLDTSTVLAVTRVLIMRPDLGVAQVESKSLKLQNLLIEPQNLDVTTTVKWNSGAVKLEYRGQFEIRKTLYSGSQSGSQGNLNLWSLINVLSIEDYLRSVVPSEIPASANDEALKAQAVAARTYALFHSWLARKSYLRLWDVDPTTWYQSYRGALVENSYSVDPAVKATEGVVATYDGKLIEAFFSANSGGYTCTVADCFGAADRPYIVSKRDEAGVESESGGTWNDTVDMQGIDERLRKLDEDGTISLSKMLPGYQGPNDILGLEVVKRNSSHRVSQIALLMKNGKKWVANPDISKQFRYQFGLRTSLYELSTANGRDQIVVGNGFGHGVGMSQIGAMLMADRGAKFDAILKFYYDGISLLAF